MKNKEECSWKQYIERKTSKEIWSWHRLLFRAADSLAKERLASRPTQTLQLTNKREWMLTENGFDKALEILKIPKTQKDFLPTKSYEVQKIIKRLKETPRRKTIIPLIKKRKL